MRYYTKALIYLLLLFVLCIPVCVYAQQPIHIYILMGQSNMAGRGEVTAEYQKQGHDRVMVLNKDNNWGKAAHPLHFDKPKVAGVGPGLTFGIALAEAYPDVTIGLVPTAVGGTRIEKWVPGAYDSVTNTHPYDDALIRIREAKKYGEIKGVIWHQGEGNSSLKNSQGYIDRLSELIEQVRAETGNPELPFVVGELARYRKNYYNINRQLPDLLSKVANTTVISSEGLWHKGDGTHFDSPSAAEYGRRYAAGMLQLQGRPMAGKEKKAGPSLAPQVQKEGDWEMLFDGGDPNVRWRAIRGDQFPLTGWEVEGEELKLLPGRKGRDIITREQFSDFELVLDFKLTDSANTGIKYFVSPLKNEKGRVALNGPEYQLIDDFKHESVKDGKSPETTTASVYLLYAPQKKALKPTGEWNEARIVAKGKHVEHWLNGVKVLEYERGSPEFKKRVVKTKFKEYLTPYGQAKSGHILLQDHNDAAYFKNIRIRRL